MRIWRHASAALLVLLLTACGGGGSSSPPSSPPQASNQAPTAAIAISGAIRQAPTGSISATSGSQVVLSGASSTDPENDALTYLWTLVSKPAGSASTLTNPANVTASITLDKLGDYVFSLKVTDSKAATSEKQLIVTVDNTAPISSVSVAVQYTPVSVDKPAQHITLGSAVSIDATATIDPDGQALSHTFDLVQRPVGSSAMPNFSGIAIARLIPDMLGTYVLRVRSTDVRGIYADTNFTFVVDNQPPLAVVTVDTRIGAGATTTSSITASVGYDVVLNGGASTDPDGNTLTYTWALSSPFGSVAKLSATNTPSVLLAPDVMGTYTATLTVTDTSGAKSDHIATINVNNRRPIASIGSNATPQSLPMATSIRIPPGTELTLRGGGSTDADGDTLTYLWQITSAPVGSNATLLTPNAVDTIIRPDVAGTYAISLRVTDSKGAFSERIVFVDSGNYPPRAILDKTRAMVLLGDTVTASAATSFDQDGDPLTFSWAVDLKPIGSTATIANPSTAALSFLPDKVGSYVLSVTVSDGKNSSIAQLELGVRSTLVSTMTLAFEPLDFKYSKAKDLLVMISAAPNSVRIVDPIVGTVRNVSLPLLPKAIGVSADGRRAAVAHDAAVSYIDLDNSLLLRTVSLAGNPTEVFVTNDGYGYLLGQTGGQWNGFILVDLNTGTVLSPGNTFGWVYSSARGVFADKLNKAFWVNPGLSPADVSYFNIDPTSHQITTSGDSPYHGDYSIFAPLWLSAEQDLVFTGAGTYFRSVTLNYAGTLSGGGFASMSHDGAASELLAVPNGGYNFSTGQYTGSTVYKRFTGQFFTPDVDLPFPVISALQSTGVGIFHSATGKHVMLVKTGGATTGGPGVAYHVAYR